MPLGIVIERWPLASRWQSWEWRPVAVIPGAGPADPLTEWRTLPTGEEGRLRIHAGTLTLLLHRRATEGYLINLSQEPPRLFVGLRDFEDAPPPRGRVHGEGAGEDWVGAVHPFVVTASPFEAQDYLDSGEDLIEPVAMPVDVIAFVQAFCDRHHVDEPFNKRKRRDWTERASGPRPRFSGAGGNGLED